MQHAKQVKSRERVRDLAEVYTAEREVKAMLDLIPLKHPDEVLSYRYLEPACGNGNFLIEILRRKLARVNAKFASRPMGEFEFQTAKALTTIYGIDICHENVTEARSRLYSEVKSNVDLQKGSYLYSTGFFPFLRYILEKNIVQGDSINKPEDIEFIEFRARGRRFEQRAYSYASLTENKPKPTDSIDPKHFLAIGVEYRISTGCDDERVQRHFDFV